MPYSVDKEGNKWVVRKKDGGKLIGTHDSQAEALKQIVAIRLNEGK